MIARCAASAVVVVCLAAMEGAAAQSANQPPDTMAARVEACTPCHGNKGEGTSDVYFPRLAGKPAGYLYNQLLAFRSGRRRYPPMNYLLEFLPDPYLQAMAEYFAAQHPPLPPSAPSEVSNEVLAQGEKLATRGDAARSIPACVSCHGPALTGMEPGIPGLLGLRANYVSAQLGACGPTNRRAFFLSVALAFLPFLFLRLDGVFQIPRDSSAERWIVSSVKALALKTLAAAAKWLRLYVHQRILHREHGRFRSQRFRFDRT